MVIDRPHDREFFELTAKFPLMPLEDEASYEAALEILDRIFALDDRRTRAEREYFRALARIAHEYEVKREMIMAPG